MLERKNSGILRFRDMISQHKQSLPEIVSVAEFKEMNLSLLTAQSCRWRAVDFLCLLLILEGEAGRKNTESVILDALLSDGDKKTTSESETGVIFSASVFFICSSQLNILHYLHINIRRGRKLARVWLP